MKKVLKWIGIVFGVLLVIGIIGAVFGKKDTTAQPAATSNTIISDSTDSSKNLSTPNNWQYSVDSSDKMDNAKVFLAECTATEPVDLQPPYDGGAIATIIVRNGFKHHKNEAIISMDKGQFMPSLEGDQSIEVKFDNEKPQTFSYNDAADGSDNIIFLNNSTSFIQKIKKANHVIIEAQFFENGDKQIEFNTKDLVWNYK
jgi:hypothetical protein